jgi:type II secretory pathway pseudopilin PulG
MRLKSTEHQSGFTLVEILVATLAGMVMMAGFFGMSRLHLFTMQDQGRQIDVQSIARNIAQVFADDVRGAGADPTCVDTFEAIPAASDTYIRVLSDRDGDGLVDGVNEDVTYLYINELHGIYRYTPDDIELLVNNIDLSGSGIQYIDGNGATIGAAGSWLSPAQRDSIRRVRLVLRIAHDAIDPGRDDPVRATLATDINLRNRFLVADTSCS